MRAVLVLFAVVVSVGCAHRQYYESVQAGPRARINFVSPDLEERFMLIERLSLVVLEPDENCTFASKGGIFLSVRRQSVATYVPANRRAYFIIRQEIAGARTTLSDTQLGFSFVPEDGTEYTVEHIDSPSRFRVKYYKHERDREKIPFEVQGLNACETRSGARARTHGEGIP